jgi:hypothetical protein
MNDPKNTPNPEDGNEGKVTPQTPEIKGTEGDGGTPNQNPPVVDYKEKFGESTTENQRLMEIMKSNGIDPKTGEPINKPADITPKGDDPSTFTDADLADEIVGFEYLSEDEKAVIRNAKSTAKTLSELKKTVASLVDEKNFEKELKVLLANKAYSVIAENLDAFRAYAYKDENLKIPLKHLANSYLVEKGQTAPATPEEKRDGLEDGSAGGYKAPPKPEGYTAEEMERMRKNDPKKYIKLARSGKLKIRG